MGRSSANWVRTLSFPQRASPKKEDIGQPPSYTEIYPEGDGEKDIMSAVVVCINHKQGCTWRDQLQRLKDHLKQCQHDTTPCVNQCGAHVPRVMMDEHVHNTCARRCATCQHCSRQFSARVLEEHSGNCSQEPIYCENKCGCKLARILMTHHRSSECAKRLTDCRYCAKSFVAETLQAHLAKCGKFPVSCPHKCERSLTRDSLEEHVLQCPNAIVKCAFVEAGCRFTGSKQSVEQHMISAREQHLLLLCSVVARQQQQIAALRLTAAQPTAAPTNSCSCRANTSGQLLWKIGELAERRAAAREQQAAVELVSEPFYSSQYGYRLQASLFLNGNGAGEGSHLSIYIKILPGEYDALLRWPFAHTVSFTMYDQATKPEEACNIVESFIPDPTWKNFQRPSRKPDVLGFGFPRFISHEMLKRRFFVRDDTMFIRVKVEPGRIAAV